MLRRNEIGKGTRRYFVITSLGRNRWYWVVWPSLRELQAASNRLYHIAEGIKETKETAVENTLAVAGRYAVWIAAKYAKTYYQNNKANLKSMADSPLKSQATQVPVVQEFLFRDIYDPTVKQWQAVPHGIVKRTRKYIYVDQNPFTIGNLTTSWLDGDASTYKLDRQSLDVQGYAFIPATSFLTDQEEPIFFVSARHTWQGSQLPIYLQVLHLSWPCTVTEVHEAYRKLVRSVHPDGGGSHEKFIELQVAYEQALHLCR